MKSPEFMKFIQKYMVHYAYKHVGDLDRAEDIVQYAWTEALKKVDFNRSDNEVRDYMIEAVKYVIANDWKRTHATGTGIHDADKTVLMSELEFQKNRNRDSKSEYTIPSHDGGFDEFEVSHDVMKAISKAFNKMEEIEKKFIRLILSGFTPNEASVECGHDPDERWGYFRLKKLRDSFAVRKYLESFSN